MDALSSDAIRCVAKHLSARDVARWRRSCRAVERALRGAEFLRAWLAWRGWEGNVEPTTDWACVGNLVGVYCPWMRYADNAPLLFLRGARPTSVKNNVFVFQRGALVEPPPWHEGRMAIAENETAGVVWQPKQNQEFTVVLRAAIGARAFQHNFLNVWIGPEWRVVLEIRSTLSIWCEGSSTKTDYQLEFDVPKTYALQCQGKTLSVMVDGRTYWTYRCRQIPAGFLARVYVGSDRHDAYWGAMSIGGLAVFTSASPECLALAQHVFVQTSNK